MNLATPSSTAPHWAKSLNEAQRRAACFGNPIPGGVEASPLLIIAGAGTGKTNTLAHRVAHLLLHGVAAEQILLLTFSRRAAQEMQKRAELIVARVSNETNVRTSGAGRLQWSGTFHSIANRLLRRYAAHVGLDSNFSILDRGDAADLLDVARQDSGLSTKQKRFPRKDTCLAVYSHCVNTRETLQGTLEQVFPWCLEWHDDLKQLFHLYVEQKQKQQVLDYDDLLLYWHGLMQEPALARDIGEQFAHILVDEYQDTNVLQAEILLALRPSGKGLCVVGDDAQAIYSFRAATVENILQFPHASHPLLESLR